MVLFALVTARDAAGAAFDFCGVEAVLDWDRDAEREDAVFFAGEDLVAAALRPREVDLDRLGLIWGPGDWPRRVVVRVFAGEV